LSRPGSGLAPEVRKRVISIPNRVHRWLITVACLENPDCKHGPEEVEAVFSGMEPLSQIIEVEDIWQSSALACAELIDHIVNGDAGTKSKHRGANSRKSRKQRRLARTPDTSVAPWSDPPRRSCFVMDGNRFMFWHGGKKEDLRLGAKSRAHKLLALFAAAEMLLPKTVKGEICTEKTRPSEAVRNVNRSLNKKIAAFGFQNIPKNVAFIYYDGQTNTYCIRPRVLHRKDADELLGLDS
jgi:hypothetical protein